MRRTRIQQRRIADQERRQAKPEPVKARTTTKKRTTRKKRVAKK